MFSLYAIEEPDGPIKIGIAMSVEARLATLQSGNPRPLRVAAILGSYATRAECEEAEAEAHRLLAPYRLSGEWFARVKAVRRYVEEGDLDPNPPVIKPPRHASANGVRMVEAYRLLPDEFGSDDMREVADLLRLTERTLRNYQREWRRTGAIHPVASGRYVKVAEVEGPQP